MHSYRERLRAPLTWWLAGGVTMFMFGAIVWTGFDLAVTVAVFAALFGILAAFLLNWGRATIEVSDGVLTAGQESLPLTAVGEVRALDETQARALRGPRADPRAYLLIRPYLYRAVFIKVSADDVAAPYWLVGTRHPAELAAAIQSSRPMVSQGGMSVG
ncbi:MAG: DUF3093 domain-containing protein [Streptosporangiaceae bacterium]